MYTFNLFCFGHDLSSNEDLVNLLYEHDFLFSFSKGENWKVDSMYHGGSTSIPFVLGNVIISDDDVDKKTFLKKIRQSKEDEYIKDYKHFLSEYLEHLDSETKSDQKLIDIVDELKTFLNNNEPCFYLLEASS